MNKIVSVDKAIKIAQKLREEKKRIVLAGGCFDILHLGHIEFLEKAKRKGDALFVLLESDKTIQKIKGKNRPINSQQDRAKVLSSLSVVDYVVNLLFFETNKEYDDLIIGLKPTIIATTKGDPKRGHKERQAAMTGAMIVDVVDRIAKKSTSKLARQISQDYYL